MWKGDTVWKPARLGNGRWSGAATEWVGCQGHSVDRQEHSDGTVLIVDRSVFVREQEGSDRTVPLGDYPDAFAHCRPIDAVEPVAVLDRLVVECPVVRADLAPVVLGMADQELDQQTNLPQPCCESGQAP